MQAQAMAHMGNKLAASLAIDGKFSTDGLAAMCDDDSMEMAMARALVDNLTEDPQTAWEHAHEREREEPDVLSFEEFKAQLAQKSEEEIQQEIAELLALFGA